MQRDFWVKDGVWGKVAVQKNFWVKNGALGENGRPKGLWVKIGVLGEWPCKGTFGLKWGFRGNKHAKELLG